MRQLRLAALLVTFVSASALAQSNPQPLLYPSLVPVSTAPGGPAFSLTVNGTGFVAGAVVEWNGSPRTTTFISSSSVQAAISAADIATAKTALITVVNPAPGGGTSNMVYFPVTNPEATVSVALDSGLTASNGAGGIVAADFNGDGILDIVAAEGSPDGSGFFVAFYQGNGDGTFKAPVFSRTNYFSAQNSLFGPADFNGDGKPDLIITGYLGGFSESSAVLLNNGDGTFSEQKLFGEGDYGGPDGVGDFTGNGKLDLLQIGCTQGFCNLFYLSGDGEGGFGKSHVIDGLNDIDGDVAIGDFNGDGKLDFVVTGVEGGPVQIFLGNGDGTFQPPTTIAGASGVYIAAADLNGDGKLDLVTNGVCVLLGNGDGTFNTSCTTGNYVNGPINLGDFNGDGKLDLAVNGSADFPSLGQIEILPGNGDGTFGAPIVAGANTSGWVIGDFNNDGRLDFGSVGTTGVLQYWQTGGSLAPLALTYASQNAGTTSATQIVTLTNNGSTALKIASVGIGGTDPADFAAASHCGSSVAAGSSCTISVAFKPTTFGSRYGTLTVTYGGPVKTSQVVELSGTGVTTTASFSPNNFGFGYQIVGTTSAPTTATLTNAGPETLTISGFTLNGAPTGIFNYTTNCGSTLAVNASCEAFLTFTPAGVAGYSATLTANTNAQNYVSVSMGGSGTYLLESPTSLSFGNQAVGTSSAPMTVTLTNEATTQYVHLGPVVISGDFKDFSETTTCGSSILPGTSCTVTVTFTPTETGARTGTLGINGTGGPQNVPLTGTGT
jgi:hypothetical protein